MIESKIVYKSRFLVPFFWADPAGVLFFGNIYFAAHQIWEEWSHGEAELWNAWFGLKKTGYPIRHSSADYFGPMTCGDIFDVILRVESVSKSSFILITEFSKANIVQASVKTVHTAIDIEKREKSVLDSAVVHSLNMLRD